jgi:GNAT superfamily N-acetyltransferase
MESENALMDLKSYVADDRLHDGRVLHTRSIRPDDKPILIRGLHNLSKEARYFRFFTHKEAFSDEELAYFTELDFTSHVGLIAFVVEGEENTERAVAIGRYIVSPVSERKQAEVAFVVKEEYRGLGIGSILLKHLVEIARTQGLESFIAFVMPDNSEMLRVFRKSNLPMHQEMNNVGVFEVSLSLKH